MALVSIVSGWPAEAASQSPTPGVVELANGRWYTGSGFEARTLYMEAGMLRSRPSAPPDSVIDLAGRWIVPPFGDAHTHNLDGPFGLEGVRDAYLSEGTFYVSVLTNTRGGADDVRAAFDDPCSIDVTYANGGLTSTLSHPFLAYEPRAMGLYDDWASHADEIRTSRIRENDAYWFIDGAPDLDRKWAAILEGEPDLLKVFLLDASEDPPPISSSGLPEGHGLRPSLVPLITARAHDAGLRVAAHVETAADMAVAVGAGVDILAHVPGYLLGSDADGGSDPHASSAPFEISEPLAADAGRSGLLVTPTVSWTYAATGPDSAMLVERRHALMKRNLARLQAHGARIVVGSDWYGDTAWREVRALADLGLWSAPELLEMWAVHTPRAVFPDRRIGRLEDGYEASFLALDADPLQDLGAVRRIAMRVKQGCRIPPP